MPTFRESKRTARPSFVGTLARNLKITNVLFWTEFCAFVIHGGRCEKYLSRYMKFGAWENFGHNSYFYYSMRWSWIKRFKHMFTLRSEILLIQFFFETFHSVHTLHCKYCRWKGYYNPELDFPSQLVNQSIDLPTFNANQFVFICPGPGAKDPRKAFIYICSFYFSEEIGWLCEKWDDASQAISSLLIPWEFSYRRDKSWQAVADTCCQKRY